MRRSRLLLVLIAASAAGAAWAKDAGPTLFLSPGDLDIGLKLQPPPAEGSPAERGELAQLHRLERARTPAGWAQAKWDDSHEDGDVFAPALGLGADLSKAPATRKLLADVRDEEKIVGKHAKVHFARKRPWIVDPSLKTCSREDGPLTSYPSGHTTMAYAMATVLVAADPARSSQVMARANAYGHERLVCAMHYRSDIEAGRTLGVEIGKTLLAKPAFQAEVRAAAAELKRTS
jgi:acid phosphatase (class A)